MAAGCPVVAARSGGIPDIVTDGVNGYLFDPQADIQEAINATIRLLKQREEITIIRTNARAEAEKWGWTSAKQQLEDYYQKIILNSHRSQESGVRSQKKNEEEGRNEKEEGKRRRKK